MAQSTQVYCDSTYRYGGSTSNFTYMLKKPLDNMTSFKLISAEIPLTYYNVRNNAGAIDNNNIFYFNEGSTTKQAVLTPGYYTSTTIIPALQTAMNLAGTNTYIVTFNATTGLFTITGTGVWASVYPSFLSVNWLLGFWASASLATIHVADTAPTLDYYQYFYLRLGLNSQFCFDETGSQNRIIKIPISNPQGSVQYYFDTSDNKFQLFSNTPQQSFTVELLDSDYYPINLNGREYSFTLSFYHQ